MADVRRNYWWGEPWPSAEVRADICDDDRFRIAVPVGEPCMHCPEPIEAGDRGVTYPAYIGAEGQLVAEPLHAHIECNFRNTQPCAARWRGEPCDHTRPYREDALEVWERVTGRPHEPAFPIAPAPDGDEHDA
jgi:hypothetical protein